MNRDSILAVIRHGLTFAGGGLATNGLATQDEITQLVGAIVTLVGLVWSILEKRQSQSGKLKSES